MKTVLIDNMASLEVTVTISKALNLRIWIAMKLIKLACKIATFGYKEQVVVE